MLIPASELPLWMYHASSAVSNSKLGVFRKCPMLYKRTFLDQTVQRKSTKALDLGAGFDCALFDGDEKFAQDYICRPETYTDDKGTVKPWHSGSNTCKAWLAQQESDGKTVLEKDALTRFQAMRQAIKAHPLASALLSQGEAQMTIRRHAEIFDLEVQVRPDWLSRKPIECPDLGLSSGGLPYVVDLKTTEDFSDWYDYLDPSSQRSGSPVYKWGYHNQAGFCQWVAFQDIGKTAHFLLVVEKHEPFRVGVICLADDYLELGWDTVRGDLQRLAACKLTDQWPNSPQHVITLSPPNWLLEKGAREMVASADAGFAGRDA